jgi:hypothetical protein
MRGCHKGTTFSSLYLMITNSVTAVIEASTQRQDISQCVGISSFHEALLQLTGVSCRVFVKVNCSSFMASSGV